MRRTSWSTLAVLVLFQLTTSACAQTPASQASLTLTPLWETDTLLTTIESAIYDPETNVIYTANIDGHFMEKDGQGSIGKVTLDGRIVDAKWVSGLHAPTGTGIHNGHLFVTDIDAIVEINLATAEVVRRVPIDGAVALNDLAIAPDGTVYVSDTGGNTVYALREGVIEPVAESLDTPNGLLVEGGRLLITRWTPRTVDWLDLGTQALTPMAQDIAGPDGLEAVGDGSYLASGFDGRIYHVHADGRKTLLLDTSGDGIRAADIDYIPETRLLLVPTMQSNRLMAYRLSE
ncbi:MAG: ATP-binding protein [Bacteroidota bacterium]